MSRRQPRSRRRRSCLAVLATLVLGAIVLTTGGLAIAWVVVPTNTVGDVDFDRPLAIPPLAESTVDADGTRAFQLTAQEGTSDLGEDEPTTTWGFNGAYLGPTLRVSRGEQVRVGIRNELREDTTVHWHGMHVPAAMDGGPHQPIEPGGSWEPTWTVDQPAATLWYHPHPHGRTAAHVARGLAGMVIVDDPVEAELDLPREYGVDDLPVMVQDVSINGDEVQASGDRGGKILVNGTVGPYAEVSTEVVRLRLLNGSRMRVYEFGLDDGTSLTQVASDGGLLPEPVDAARVKLSPGERAEVLVAMDPGEDRVLRSYPTTLDNNVISDRFNGGADTLDVLQLRAADSLEPSAGPPESLVPDIAEHAGREADVAVTRTFRLQGRTINGEAMDMGRIDEVVSLGDTEVWEVDNTDGAHHNFHVHDVQFRVLTVDGAPPPPELAGLKDTVFLPPGSRVRLLMTFDDHADPDVPYMYHCHLLRHEDQGMMGQFIVVEDGADVPDRVGHGGHPH